MNPYGRPRTHRLDGNQQKIVSTLKQKGYTVFTLATNADVIVGHRGMNFIFEIKDPAQPKSKRRLTTAEIDFATKWAGQLSTVTTAEQIESIIAGKISIFERGKLRTLKSPG